MSLKFSFFLRLGFVFLMNCVLSCKKDNLPQVPGMAKLNIPAYFPVLQENKENPLTEDGISLGRMLFYDVRLSGNNKISCASCHHQELAFSDGQALSAIGASGKTLTRHAPVLFNLAWAKGLFWDGGSSNLESQAFGPLTSQDEMHQDLYELETELNRVPEYLKRFKLAFNDRVSATNVVKALAQFQRTLISSGSKYDQYLLGRSDLSDLELKGLKLVAEKCSGCHSGALFTDFSYHNNGIDVKFSDAEEGVFQGRFRVSFNPVDLGKYKTPSLRNVMLTGPYMHDGRFRSIDEVLAHYNSGIKASATIDLLLYQNGGKIGIPLSKADKTAIISFLSALTDYELINNQQISNPN